MTEKEFFQKIKNFGGRAYLVGGAVRDAVMGIDPHDRDYVICGMELADFTSVFPDARPVGLSFPVFLLDIGGAPCEVAFARREIKSGTGYKGFKFSCGKDISIEEDLFRRDTTINSMARDEHGNIIDPYGGVRDIRDKKLRAVSDHFCEDPIRALRAARQAAQFEFDIAGPTLLMMKECGHELKSEPRERKFAELEKALLCGRPSLYFRNLQKAGLLADEFPWLFSLIGAVPPDTDSCRGDAFENAMETADRAARFSERSDVRFAALVHCAGMVLAANELIAEADRPLGLPGKWRKSAAFAIKEHMRAPLTADPAKIRDLLRSAEKSSLGIDGLKAIVLADGSDSLPDWIADAGRYLDAMRAAAKGPIPNGLRGPDIAAYIRQNEINAVAGLAENKS